MGLRVKIIRNTWQLKYVSMMQLVATIWHVVKQFPFAQIRQRRMNWLALDCEGGGDCGWVGERI